jgi:hypothetical protein
MIRKTRHIGRADRKYIPRIDNADSLTNDSPRCLHIKTHLEGPPEPNSEAHKLFN